MYIHNACGPITTCMHACSTMEDTHARVHVERVRTIIQVRVYEILFLRPYFKNIVVTHRLILIQY